MGGKSVTNCANWPELFLECDRFAVPRQRLEALQHREECITKGGGGSQNLLEATALHMCGFFSSFFNNQHKRKCHIYKLKLQQKKIFQQIWFFWSMWEDDRRERERERESTRSWGFHPVVSGAHQINKCHNPLHGNPSSNRHNSSFFEFIWMSVYIYIIRFLGEKMLETSEKMFPPRV